VLDLVRAALPAVLNTVRLLPSIESPTVRDFVASDEHVEGVVQWIAVGPVRPPSSTRRRLRFLSMGSGTE
jgi:hypothetical protein